MSQKTVSNKLSRTRQSTSRPAKRAALYSVLSLAVLTVPTCVVVAQTAPTADNKVDKVFYTAKDRQEAIRKALLFKARAVAEANIIEGPEQDKKEFQLHFNDKVTCDFTKPGSQMGGKTPKFECHITKVETTNGDVQTPTDQLVNDPLKVKYGADDNEVYAEVASTRLFWALGFYADAWYPVRVECHGCPENPEAGSGSKDTRTYDPATIVHKAKGKKMYEAGKDDEGWSWKELDSVNGRPTYERDGLKLMAAFVSHSDNKPPQQRLVCSDVNVDQTTNPFTTTCSESRMIVQDLGATFGGGGLFTSNSGAKMNLSEWSGEKVWKKVGTNTQTGAPGNQICQAQLRKSLTATDGLSDPIISEEGRRFAAGLLCQLSDQQIVDLFRVARVAQMPANRNQDAAAVVQKWVDAFKQKREQIASGRCRWNTQPTDMNAIDNPAGLSTVPNFCSAKLF